MVTDNEAEAAIAASKRRMEAERATASAAIVGKHYATLYEGVDVGRTGAKFEPLLFIVRRTIVAALLVY